MLALLRDDLVALKVRQHCTTVFDAIEKALGNVASVADDAAQLPGHVAMVLRLHPVAAAIGERRAANLALGSRQVPKKVLLRRLRIVV
jgi:hypothetical protein